MSTEKNEIKRLKKALQEILDLEPGEHDESEDAFDDPGQAIYDLKTIARDALHPKKRN